MCLGAVKRFTFFNETAAGEQASDDAVDRRARAYIMTDAGFLFIRLCAVVNRDFFMYIECSPLEIASRNLGHGVLFPRDFRMKRRPKRKVS